MRPNTSTVLQLGKQHRAVLATAVLLLSQPGPARATSVLIFPLADGTIVDADNYGGFDSVGDEADWSFNGSGLEIGGVSRSVPDVGARFEYRTVWEYDLTGAGLSGPVTAWLTFTVKGTTAFLPDADLHIFAYPANLREELADFSAGPAVFADHVTVAARQDAAIFSVCVGDVVTAERARGGTAIGFRFQIDPDSPYAASQAHVIAKDADDTTKPTLSISLAGDANRDDAVDYDDLGPFTYCMTGPEGAPLPSCQHLDLDCDGDIDLDDFSRLQSVFGGTQ